MDIGVVYHIESAQQFWSGTHGFIAVLSLYLNIFGVFGSLELGDILSLPKNATLGTIDANLRNFITFCATYHG